MGGFGNGIRYATGAHGVASLEGRRVGRIQAGKKAPQPGVPPAPLPLRRDCGGGGLPADSTASGIRRPGPKERPFPGGPGAGSGTVLDTAHGVEVTARPQAVCAPSLSGKKSGWRVHRGGEGNRSRQAGLRGRGPFLCRHSAPTSASTCVTGTGKIVDACALCPCRRLF